MDRCLGLHLLSHPGMGAVELDEKCWTLGQTQLAVLVARCHLDLADLVVVGLANIENLIQQFDPGNWDCSLQGGNNSVYCILQALGEEF